MSIVFKDIEALRAINLLQEAERIVQQSNFYIVNEDIIDIILIGSPLEWRPKNLLPEDSVGL